MESGYFYFIKDEFFDSLPGCGLMLNKEGENHSRPCYYCFQYGGYSWMVPISSRIAKYQAIYDKQIEKRGFCDTILFGFVNGSNRAFLIQNAFPISEDYVAEQYMVNKNTVPVTVNSKIEKAIHAALRKVIRLYERGTKLTLTDLDRIIAFLNSKVNEDERT